MASAAELWPSGSDQYRWVVRGQRLLSAVPEEPDVAADRAADRCPRHGRTQAVVGDVPVALDAVWRSSQPGRGAVVRARYKGHHTAGLIFSRDDREGHPGAEPGGEPQTWWSHEE